MNGTAKANVARKAQVLRSWDDVDERLARLGGIIRRMEQAEAALTERVARLREENARRLAPLEAEQRRLEGEIETFARGRKEAIDDIEGGKALRSVNLNHGRVGFRRSARIVVADEEEAMRQAREAGMEFCLRRKEWLDKTALRPLPEDELTRIGAERIVEDRFWYEIEREVLASHQGARGTARRAA